MFAEKVVMRTRVYQRCWLAATFVAVMMLQGCSDSVTPEQEIRAWMDELETAAESMTIAPIREAVAKGFIDNHGNNREAIINITRGVLLARRPLHIFRREVSLFIADPMTAELTTIVVGAKTPVDDIDGARDAGVDFAWLKLVLTKTDDDWKVASASWRAATADDLF